MSILKPSAEIPSRPLRLRDLDSEASERVEAARRDSESLIAAARAEAGAILEAARAERAEAASKGRAEGLEAGRLAGRAEGRAAALAAGQADLAPGLDQARSALAAMRAASEHAAQRATADAEGAVVRLALAVARLIVGREATVDAEAIRTNVERVLRRAARRSGIELRIHPADRAAVEAFLPDLAARFDGLGIAAIVDDPALSRGGCRAQLQDGDVDAEIRTQLDEIERILLGDGR